MNKVNLKPILDFCKNNNLKFIEEYDRDNFCPVLKIFLAESDMLIKRPNENKKAIKRDKGHF